MFKKIEDWFRKKPLSDQILLGGMSILWPISSTVIYEFGIAPQGLEGISGALAGGYICSTILCIPPAYMIMLKEVARSKRLNEALNGAEGKIRQVHDAITRYLEAVKTLGKAALRAKGEEILASLPRLAAEYKSLETAAAGADEVRKKMYKGEMERIRNHLSDIRTLFSRATLLVLKDQEEEARENVSALVSDLKAVASLQDRVEEVQELLEGLEETQEMSSPGADPLAREIDQLGSGESKVLELPHPQETRRYRPL